MKARKRIPGPSTVPKDSKEWIRPMFIRVRISEYGFQSTEYRFLIIDLFVMLAVTLRAASVKKSAISPSDLSLATKEPLTLLIFIIGERLFDITLSFSQR